jgi:hypothetical protein
LFLQCQQTSDGQDFFLFHRTTEAIIRSQEVLNDPNLFGALKMDRNLQAEGNVILGWDSDDDEGEDVVFEVTLPPSDDEAASDEEESDAEEFVKTMSLGEAILEHWNQRKTKLNMHIQLQLGHCVWWRKSVKMSGWEL